MPGLRDPLVRSMAAGSPARTAHEPDAGWRRLSSLPFVASCLSNHFAFSGKRYAVTTKPLARRTLRVGKSSGRRLRMGHSWRLSVLASNYITGAMTGNAIAKEVVDAAFRIRTTLGPGLLESVYETVLGYELDRRELRIVRQQPIPVWSMRTSASTPDSEPT